MWMDYDERAMAEAEMRAEQEHFDSIEPDRLSPSEEECRAEIERDDAEQARLDREDALDAEWIAANVRA